ncbi:alkaline phosphatase, partial [Salmonella sp. s54395]|uniref:alkaline phosphatase n=1 Tax=Salmonella sp. s54395 TaxID=3159664 RepID=UPI00398091CF
MAFAGGYQDRGHDILGQVETASTLDGLPYTTLGYLNGPGGALTSLSFATTGVRPNLTGVETNANSFVNEALVPLFSETHAGEDVPIYAMGPFAHLFTSVHEQHYIAHVIRYAACLGDGRQVCTDAIEPICDGAIYACRINIILLTAVTAFL